MENVKAESPVSTPAVTPTAPAAAKEAQVTPAASAAPAPGTPEFAAWAWENRGV